MGIDRRPPRRHGVFASGSAAPRATGSVGLAVLSTAAALLLPSLALAQVAAAPETAAQQPVLPHELSPWNMFLAADWVVKSVMVALAAASLATWTIWLAKTVQIALARGRARRSLKAILAARTLSDAAGACAGRRDPASLMLQAAQEESAASEAVLVRAGGEGLKERVASALGRIEVHGAGRMTRGTGLLATIGSVAPFVGLFGTVWGIMNAFIGISKAQTTNLAVVAPGIAEALLATAIGLVAAIPAVVVYNIFARSITAYRHILADAAAGVERLVSRDIDVHTAQAAPGDALRRAAE